MLDDNNWKTFAKGTCFKRVSPNRVRKRVSAIASILSALEPEKRWLFLFIAGFQRSLRDFNITTGHIITNRFPQVRIDPSSSSGDLKFNLAMKRFEDYSKDDWEVILDNRSFGFQSVMTSVAAIEDAIPHLQAVKAWGSFKATQGMNMQVTFERSIFISEIVATFSLVQYDLFMQCANATVEVLTAPLIRGQIEFPRAVKKAGTEQWFQKATVEFSDSLVKYDTQMKINPLSLQPVYKESLKPAVDWIQTLPELFVIISDRGTRPRLLAETIQTITTILRVIGDLSGQEVSANAELAMPLVAYGIVHADREHRANIWSSLLYIQQMFGTSSREIDQSAVLCWTTAQAIRTNKFVVSSDGSDSMQQQRQAELARQGRARQLQREDQQREIRELARQEAEKKRRNASRRSLSFNVAAYPHQWSDKSVRGVGHVRSGSGHSDRRSFHGATGSSVHFPASLAGSQSFSGPLRFGAQLPTGRLGLVR